MDIKLKLHSIFQNLFAWHFILNFLDKTMLSCEMVCQSI